MEDTPVRVPDGVPKRGLSRKPPEPRKLSKETTDKLLAGMMRDQTRFGIDGSQRVSPMRMILSNLRKVLRNR